MDDSCCKVSCYAKDYIVARTRPYVKYFLTFLEATPEASHELHEWVQLGWGGLWEYDSESGD